MSRVLFAILAVAVGSLTGCTRSDSAVPIDTGGKAALEDLGQMLKSIAEEGRKPPAKLTELETFEPMIPVAGPALRSGEIVYIWGAAYAASGTQVVAYEKKAPAEGGFVLVQDGTVKSMSASEFQSAPKAK
jgi:hypothetical protein